LIARAFNAEGEKVADLESFNITVSNAIKSMDQSIPYVINALIGTTAFRVGSLSM
jgi:hypothetical protein